MQCQRWAWVFAFTLGCSSKEEEPKEPESVLVPFDCPDLPPDPTKHTVLVFDRGFDLSLPVFQGKIAGCYTVTCSGGSPGEEAKTYDDLRRITIDEAKRQDTSCTLKKGIALRKSKSFESIAGKQDAWNRVFFEKRATSELQDARATADILEGEGTFSYHGTSTASAIGFDNPNVRFVFVEEPRILRSASEISCPRDQDIRDSERLYRDPEVKAALIASPLSLQDEDLMNVMLHHGVTLENASFGSLPRTMLERMCPSGAWAGYFGAVADIVREQSARMRQTLNQRGLKVLTVAAAGNEGATIDSRNDLSECVEPRTEPLTDAESAEVMVGSYSPQSFARSSFTNFGACVELLAPGEGILTLTPDGFALPLSGTSFSTPLTVRLLSMSTPPQATPRAMLESLRTLVAAQPERKLPLASFDARMFYIPGTPGVARFQSRGLSLQSFLAPGRLAPRTHR